MKKLIPGLLFTLWLAPIFAQTSTDFAGNPIPGIVPNPNPYDLEISGHEPGTIVKVFPSPNQSYALDEVAFDGQHLWVAGYDEYYFHQISTTDGLIIRSIPTYIARPYGLTHDGTYLWALDADNHRIVKIDPADGSAIRSFHTPAYSEQSFPGGLCWDGTHFWTADRKGPEVFAPNDSIFQVDTNGTIVAAYEAPGEYPSGLAFDGQYLWSTDNFTQTIFKIDPNTFTIEESIPAPGGPFPNGLTFDGSSLWVANNYVDSIYQVAIPGFEVSTPEIPEQASVWQVFPNPTSDQITFQQTTTNLQTGSIRLYNLQGQLIRQKGFTVVQRVTMNVSDLPAGRYQYQILEEKGVLSHGALIKR